MIGQVKTIVKQYFTFSRNERKGVILLLLFLVVALLFRILMPLVVPQQPLNVTINQLPSGYLYEENKTEIVEDSSSKISYFPFNPNTASDEELKALGFTERNITSLRKYQAKGGRFKKPDDLLKLYGLSAAHKQALLPYVVIPELPSDSSKQKQRNPKAKVELNSADTNQLIALYRIGPSMARRILEYRNKLGGFVSLQQLKEVWGFDEDLLYDLQDQLTLDPSKARMFNLNTVGVDELKTHPYFKYKLSGVIINYRNQHGPFNSLDDLKKIVLVNDSVYQKITLYLKLN